VARTGTKFCSSQSDFFAPIRLMLNTPVEPSKPRKAPVQSSTCSTLLPGDLEFTAFNRDEKFASAFLGVGIETLRFWRKKRRGPPYRKLGPKLVRYSLGALGDWVEAQPLPGEEGRR
jgi:hypothetical protein